MGPPLVDGGIGLSGLVEVRENLPGHLVKKTHSVLLLFEEFGDIVIVYVNAKVYS